VRLTIPYAPVAYAQYLRSCGGRMRNLWLRRYEPWFQAACELLFSKVAPGQFAIFYQTDIKMLDGVQVWRASP
jgi:hypothetical protein